MMRLFSNKRGQIPVVSDISNFIGSAIQWLTQSAPKPFRILFFMLLLVFGAVLFSFAIRMMGYHCNTANVPYTVSAFNIIKNWDLIQSVPDSDEITSLSRSVQSSPINTIVSQDCAINSKEATVTTDAGVVTSWNDKYAYTQGFIHCVTCNLQTYKTNTTLGPTQETAACTTDAYRIPNENRSILQKTFCGWYVCEPPTNYYWRQTDNKYICTNPTICGSITIGDEWNQNLIDSGATPLYPQGYTQQLTADGAFSIQCTNMRANFTLWRIPIFDYRIWVFMLILIFSISLFKFTLQHK